MKKVLLGLIAVSSLSLTILNAESDDTAKEAKVIKNQYSVLQESYYVPDNLKLQIGDEKAKTIGDKELVPRIEGDLYLVKEGIARTKIGEIERVGPKFFVMNVIPEVQIENNIIQIRSE